MGTPPAAPAGSEKRYPARFPAVQSCGGLFAASRYSFLYVRGAGVARPACCGAPGTGGTAATGKSTGGGWVMVRIYARCAHPKVSKT